MQGLASHLPTGRSIHLRRLKHPLDENPCWELLARALIHLCAVLLSLPLLLVIVILLPLCVVARWFLLFVHWNTQRSRYQVTGGIESMGGANARWLGGSWRSSILTGVLVFDSRLPADEVCTLVLNRVLPVTPRLARVPVMLPLSAGAGYCWLPDAGFDVRRHIFDVDAGQSDVQDYLGRLMNTDLPHDKSPWEMHCLHLGLNEPKSFHRVKDLKGNALKRSPSTTVILRVHQSLADGTTLVHLLSQVLADNKTSIQTSSNYSTHSLCYSYLRACLVGPITLLCWLLCSRQGPKLPPAQSALAKQYVINCSANVEMDKVVHIKQVTRSSVNSVLLSAIAGAVRVLLQNSGVQQPADMKAVLPIDLYSQNASYPSLSSKKSSIVISLPVSVEGGVPRLWKTRQIIKDLHKSSDPFIIYLASSTLMSLVPSQYVRDALTKATENTATLKFSWLRGPDTPLTIAGRPLRAVYSLLPVQPGLGISVSVFIYADTLYITSTTDTTLGDVGSFLLHHLNAQIESLYELLKFRRNPSTKLDAITFYCFPDISTSPSTEVSRRMKDVQDEIETLMESEVELTREETERLLYLKSEFAYLLKELRKRRSAAAAGSKSSVFNKVLSPDMDLEEDAPCRPHRGRTMSCSFVARRPSLNNLLSKKRPLSLCMEARTDLARTHLPSVAELKDSSASPGQRAAKVCSSNHIAPINTEYIQLNCYPHHTDAASSLKQSSTSFNLQSKRLNFKKQKSDNNILYNGVGGYRSGQCLKHHSGKSSPATGDKGCSSLCKGCHGSVNSLVRSYSSVNKISTSPSCVSPVYSRQYDVTYHEDCQLTQVTLTQ